MSEEIAEELEWQAAQYASRATEEYPETIFPPPRLGVTSSPDAYSAAGYRNAYRLVAGELRARAAELRKGDIEPMTTNTRRCPTCDYPGGEPEPVRCPDCGH